MPMVSITTELTVEKWRAAKHNPARVIADKRGTETVSASLPSQKRVSALAVVARA
ncbi:MAG: Uncharacterised protein [Rhodospirillaceae bacterium]|nr:MAG: Uncharacterised protein [Rhodospirillaceae bacterium]